mmetsp:Transcript_20999/g.52590  ORF Transcript_20999/g.52590 Transcript_20999/m.52590 type:complete len:212 (-) Transcript_20999:1266-1901(-)
MQILDILTCCHEFLCLHLARCFALQHRLFSLGLRALLSLDLLRGRGPLLCGVCHELLVAGLGILLLLLPIHDLLLKVFGHELHHRGHLTCLRTLGGVGVEGLGGRRQLVRLQVSVAGDLHQRCFLLVELIHPALGHEDDLFCGSVCCTLLLVLLMLLLPKLRRLHDLLVRFLDARRQAGDILLHRSDGCLALRESGLQLLLLTQHCLGLIL